MLSFHARAQITTKPYARPTRGGGRHSNGNCKIQRKSQQNSTPRFAIRIIYFGLLGGGNLGFCCNKRSKGEGPD